MANKKDPNPTLKRWANKRNIFLVNLVLDMAHQCTALADACRLARDGSLDHYYTHDVCQEWQAYYYRRHDLFGNVLDDLTEATGGEFGEHANSHIEDLAGTYTFFNAYNHMNPHDKKEVFSDLKDMTRKKFIDYINTEAKTEAENQLKYFLEHCKFIRTDNLEMTGDPKTFLRSPYGSFFIRVFVPVWIETGLPYPYVHHRARRGNAYAIETILRNNPEALGDWRIKDKYNEARRDNKPKFRRFQKAIADSSKPNYPSPLDAKVFVTNLIYDSAQRIIEAGRKCREIFAQARIKITAPAKDNFTVYDVYRLFNAIARQQGKDCDNDLPAFPSFRKKMQRERDNIKNIKVNLMTSCL